jgi:hypothetical protein
MVKMHKIVKIIVTILIILAALACGSSSTNVTGVDISGTGSGTIVTESQVTGQITQFGSIYVGGIQFDISNASVTLDEQSSDTNDLRLGMWVNIITEDDTALTAVNAKKVNYISHLAGSLRDLNLSKSTFTLKGVTILVDGDTNFSTLNSFSALKDGSDIVVSGAYQTENTFLASYIDNNTRKLDFKKNRDFFFDDVVVGNKVVISGKFKELIDASTIKINEYEVTTTISTELENDLSGIKVGQHVVVHGTKTGQSSIKASRIDTPPEEEATITDKISSISILNKSIEVDNLNYFIDRHTRFQNLSSTSTFGNLGFGSLKIDDTVELKYLTKNSKRLIVKLTVL